MGRLRVEMGELRGLRGKRIAMRCALLSSLLFFVSVAKSSLAEVNVHDAFISLLQLSGNVQFRQQEAAHQPLRLNAGTEGAQNQLGARFDGFDDYLATTPIPISSKTPWVLVRMEQRINCDNGGVILSARETNAEEGFLIFGDLQLLIPSKKAR
jgi:hypothetical protein